MSRDGEWVSVPHEVAARHPLHGLDDGAAMLVLGLLFGPLLLMADFFGVVVPAVRSGVEGAEALWAWQMPYLLVAGLGWVLLVLLANHHPLAVRALPLWVALVLAMTLGLCLDAGLPAAAFVGDLAVAAAVGGAACLYAAFSPRMRVTVYRVVPRTELARLQAAEPVG